MQNRRILVTNDDGIDAKGIAALIEVAKEFGEVLVVAPHMARSGMSKAITVDTPIKIKEISSNQRVSEYSCTGTPVDCIKIAFDQLMDYTPDLILSGINHGTNSSVSIHYSGTMGAVIEGCIHQVPSIGFSLCDHSAKADFSNSKEIIRKVLNQTIAMGLPVGTCLNVNIPKGEIKGIKTVRQGHGRWVEEFDKRTDPHGRDYYWISGFYKNMDNGSIDTDNHWLEEAYATVVPIKIDMTDHAALNQLKHWQW